MVRPLAVFIVVCAFGFAAWSFIQNEVVVSETPADFLERAAEKLEKRHDETGTYARNGIAVTLWADESRYCIQWGGWFLLGPNGTPSEESCAGSS